MNIFWICIHRDWRDSNPQLPPWQGGALTNWTTIPGKKSYSIHTYSYNFIQTLFFFFLFEIRTPKRRTSIYIHILMGLRFIDTDDSQSVRYCQLDEKINESRKQKRLFFAFLTWTLSLDFILTDPDRSFAKSELVEKRCK